MTEGFDVGLEVSGNPAALRAMLANMSHGGRIAMLGIPTEEIAIDWTQVVFNMLTLRGHLRPRDVRDVVPDDGDAAVRASTSRPVITHRLPYTEFAEGFAVAGSGQSGKVVLDWTAA